MTRSRRIGVGAGFGLVVAACAGPPDREPHDRGDRPRAVAAAPGHAAPGHAAPGHAAPGHVAPGSVALSIVFEPALPAAGELQALHEDGSRVTVMTGRTGVDITLPPGPAVLHLRVGDRERQRILTVRESSEPREFVFDTTGMAP